MLKRKYIAVILPLLIISCATFGINIPETTEQKINMSSATLEGLTTTVTNDLRVGYITLEQAETFRTEAGKAREAIKTARLLLKSSNETEAIDQWMAINNILIELNARYGGER